jgi:hypothetical protein
VARLYTLGWEISSVTSGLEIPNRTTTSATLSTSVFRSGARSGRISSLVSATRSGWGGQFVSALSDGPYYARFAFRLTTAPSAANMIFAFIAGASVAATSANDGSIKVNSDGSLALFANASQVGSNSAVLSTGTWYVVQVEYDNSPASGSKVLRAYLNGTQFAGTTTSTNVGGTTNGFAAGGNLVAEAQTQGEWHFDDLAINDSTGSFENGLPDHNGKVIYLWPDGTGDSNQWLDTAAAAGSANNYQLVDETAPNDTTDLVQTVTNGHLDLYAMQSAGAAGMSGGDGVNVVQVYGRSRNNVADATTAWSPVVVKTTGGTQSTGTAYAPNSTTWRTGSVQSANQIAPNHTLYADPDAAPWTTATLDTMQVGPKLTAAGTNRAQVSTIWVVVDYTPTSSYAGDVAEEADTAVAGAGAKTTAAGVAAETDTAVAGAGLKTTAAGVAAQVDTATAGVGSKTAAGGIGAETDTAVTGAGVKTTPAGVAAQVDTATSGAGLKTAAGQPAAETDTATAGVGSKTGTASVAAEIGTAVTGAGVKTSLAGVAAETDTAITGAAASVGAGSVAAEIGTAVTGVGAKTTAGGVAAEIDRAISAESAHRPVSTAYVRTSSTTAAARSGTTTAGVRRL